MVIATPVTIVSAIGVASQKGVILKNAQVLENLCFVDRIAMDKTGTLTQGRCRVTGEIIFNDGDLNKSLNYASALELKSTHPISMAIVNHTTGCMADSIEK